MITMETHMRLRKDDELCPEDGVDTEHGNWRAQEIVGTVDLYVFC